VTDRALLTPEERQAIEAANLERKAVAENCTRRRCSAAELVSLEAIAARYPQVKRLMDASASVAKDLDIRCEPTARLEAATARFMLECSERLRAAVMGA